MASTYNAYFDSGWKSVGGGTASAITIDEGIFSYSNSNSVGAAAAALTWTTRFMINTSGNVGIGTSAPGTRLDVIGNATFGRGGGTFQGITLTNGDNSASAETVSFIDARNNLGAADGDMFFGHQTDGGSYIRWATTAPGDRAVDRRAERMRIDPNGRVGIGTSAPQQIFQVSTVGQSIDGPFFASTSGHWMRFIPNSSPGAYNGIVAAGTNSFIFSGGSPGTGSLTIAPWADATSGVVISAAGGLSVGTTTDPGAGAILASGNITAFSDIRVKDNVEQISGALDRVSRIRGVTYTRNDLEDTERRYAGVIAQEIEQVLPEAVFDSGEMKAVDYNATIGLLIEAVKELRAEVAELKGK
jgi:hypothetical protein